MYGTCDHLWWQEQSLRVSTQQDAKCQAHVVGWLSLTSDEREGITDWLAEVNKRVRPNTMAGLAEQYTVSLPPDEQWRRDEKGVRLYRRFSCVSFVLAAYLDLNQA